MPYPHLTQFETLDRRRRAAVAAGGAPRGASVVRNQARRVLARLACLLSTRRCASAAA